MDCTCFSFARPGKEPAVGPNWVEHRCLTWMGNARVRENSAFEEHVNAEPRTSDAAL